MFDQPFGPASLLKGVQLYCRGTTSFWKRPAFEKNDG